MRGGKDAQKRAWVWYNRGVERGMREALEVGLLVQSSASMAFSGVCPRVSRFIEPDFA